MNECRQQKCKAMIRNISPQVPGFGPRVPRPAGGQVAREPGYARLLHEAHGGPQGQVPRWRSYFQFGLCIVPLPPSSYFPLSHFSFSPILSLHPFTQLLRPPFQQAAPAKLYASVLSQNTPSASLVDDLTNVASHTRRADKTAFALTG